jgi:tetratricopeptide (TPR) repeat protein
MKTTTTVLACSFLFGLGGVAAADKDKDKADSLFKQGKKLMGEKKYSEACPAFEESFKLDPGIGGELNVARCYEEWGKLGRAYKAYTQAAKMAKEANDPRAPKIDELVAGLDKTVPRITIKVSKGGDPTAVKAALDGTSVDGATIGQAQVVDPGPHTIEYRVAGITKKKVVAIERGGSSDVFVEADVAAVANDGKGHDGHDTHDTHDKHDKHVDEPDRSHVETPPAPGRNQRIAGLAIGGAGVVAIGVASYMTLSARGKYNDALSAHCMSMTNGCDDTGLSITHDARHEANVATVVFVIGGLAVGGGVTLYLLAPKGHSARASDERAVWVMPSVSTDGGGIVVGGRM